MFYSGNLLRAISLGSSLSDSSKEQLQSGKGGVRIYSSLKKKKRYIYIYIYKVKHQKLLVTTKTRHLKLMILVVFYVQEDARVWAH